MTTRSASTPRPSPRAATTVDVTDSARRDHRSERDMPRPVCPTLLVDIPAVFAAVPQMLCLMTAAHEQRRGGLLVRNIMRCGDEPPSVAIAVPKGQHLSTLIRDSHAFAINLIDPPRKLLVRTFEQRSLEEDPFDTLQVRRFATGAPILACARAAFECEVTRHFDLESDHEMYVGQVIAAKVFTVPPAPTTQSVRADTTDVPRFGSMTPPVKAPMRRGEDTGGRSERLPTATALPGQRLQAADE